VKVTSSRERIGLIAGREIRARLATRAFKVTTGLLLVAASGGVVIPHLIHSGKTTYRVALVGTVPPGVAATLPAAGPQVGAVVRITNEPDEAAAEADLRHHRIDVALVDGRRLVSLHQPADKLSFLVDQVVARARIADRLATAGIGPADAAAVLDAGPLPVQALQPETPARNANRAVAFAGSLFIYVALLSYGSLIAAGVVEEKSTRVSEVLLGAVRPHELMAGKVIGIGVVGITQLVCVAIPTAVAALAIGSLHVPHGTPLTFAAVPLWFVLGYGLYSCAYAAAGASASRPEEAGMVAAPLNMVIIASYIVGLSVVSSPDGTVARVLSFVPPFAPLIMLPRAALGHVAIWEVPVSALLVVATTWLLVHLAGRIYTGAITSTGGRVKLRTALRASRERGATRAGKKGGSVPEH
jgi:ABC-2 type transport system permease protein